MSGDPPALIEQLQRVYATRVVQLSKAGDVDAPHHLEWWHAHRLHMQQNALSLPRLQEKADVKSVERYTDWPTFSLGPA